MASGINTTFRQVGTATGVAVFGSLFATHVRATVIDQLGSTSLAGHAAGIGHAIGAGELGSVVDRLPPGARPAVIQAGHAGFVNGLDWILLIGATVAFVGSAMTFLLIRERDFVDSAESDLDEPGLAQAA
jgi:hypothetical protein